MFSEAQWASHIGNQSTRFVHLLLCVCVCVGRSDAASCAVEFGSIVLWVVVSSCLVALFYITFDICLLCVCLAFDVFVLCELIERARAHTLL